MASDIAIHPPGSTHPTLTEGGPEGFDRSWFMGKWGIAWSTLPMWKDKKDVTLTYTPLPDDTGAIKFQDLLEYSKLNSEKVNTVKGVDTLTSSGPNAATFDWKGSGWLFFVHSHWEVLGHGSDEASGLEWAVTFFSKTLFSAAGIDVYVRKAASSTTSEVADEAACRALLDRVVHAVQSAGDERVTTLAQGGFPVQGAM
ncbi:hypothetical protein L198_05101 [Cryptococcus wingfieldii CBS 7118]|uniref:Uncharacterized protein n=1 Tax=Cryptococcus wingfieldii CBS 7118 TaxID=1295528 RepID=A0A1E3J0R7_9TREE|nr:hypothetical protein L198_05101 [Cryptococcus wingfieldii CBS 7118]ODN94245.1 hypothetical protein L198_05101 [Cryptococcus wingfieldii CBS 7118]